MALEQFSEKVTKLWSGWEVRVLVLLSLFLQIILIIFGSRRKYSTRIWITLVVWLSYLAADWVATVALSTLANDSINVLKAFWAPFLLLHLGGPDTITAYSLEDNELWLRHFLGLLVQVGVAIYVFQQSWINNSYNSAIKFLAIPMFITGVFKYGERTLVLRSSSASRLKDSLLCLSSGTDKGADFDQIVEALDQGSVLDIDQGDKREKSNAKEDGSNDKRIERKDDYLVEAELLFKKFRFLFADLILDHHERKESYSIIHNKSTKDAFKLVAIELGFMCDVLYTKATRIYSKSGIFLRFFCFLSHVSVSVVFLIIIDNQAYSLVDLFITYVLLFGAVFLEIYALLVLFFSDWTRLWLTKRSFISRVDSCSYGLPSNDSRRWSESMGQYNLLSFCLAEMSSKMSIVPNLFGLKAQVEKYRYLTWKDVDVHVQEMIFKHVFELSKEIEGDRFDINLCRKLLAQRGDSLFTKRMPSSLGSSITAQVNIDLGFDPFRWSTSNVEFDHSLLLWHIATDLRYCEELDNLQDTDELPIECKISKCISDYMLYLLVACPTMLGKGNGEIRYRETCAEAMRFFKRKRGPKSKPITKIEACHMLLQVRTTKLKEIKGDRSLSALFYGCKLAKELHTLKSECKWRNEELWVFISKAWIEMLTYAASHCGWKEHGRQLVRGGELLSHICLLLAHFGLSEQYQIQKETPKPFRRSAAEETSLLYPPMY